MLTTYDFLLMFRDFFTGVTWIAAIIYFLSGTQDVVYDVGVYWLRAWRHFIYIRRPRLTLERLRAREQQRIAVMVPAWNEGEVVAHMVDNIIKRVEYSNYSIFVGTYPNDPATQACVDRLSLEYPQIIKVVTSRPGPTTKADCLHHILRHIRSHETAEAVHFDVIVMHDAEDWVHPQEFLVHNYLIPQVDVIQMPILPFPSKWTKWIHWIYADEFSENHMKDVPVREKISGFVPYAGTGTSFSRKVIDYLDDDSGGYVFNESSMTEDYSMSKRICEAGFKSIFVNVVLADDNTPWWTPLSKRPMFISNWSYFPMDWRRSIRQKSRWIIGISLQEWEQTGWQGNWLMKENLLKDRKVFIAASASFLGYFVFLYNIVFGLGYLGWIPLKLLPVLVAGDPLANLVRFCTLIMALRIVQRITWVGLTYGIGQGLLAVPRLIVSNILNGIASLRALKIFADSRSGTAKVAWDNTAHLEGIGEMRGIERRRETIVLDVIPLEQIIVGLRSGDAVVIGNALHMVRGDLKARERRDVAAALKDLAFDNRMVVRAELAKALIRITWPEMIPTLFHLLHDAEAPVMQNAARALIERPKPGSLLEEAFTVSGPAAVNALIGLIEQNRKRQTQVFDLIGREQLLVTRARILGSTATLRQRYLKYVEASGAAHRRRIRPLAVDASLPDAS